MLDSPAPDFSDPRVRLAGTSFVLVEFPFMSVPPGIPGALFQLKNSGWRIVVAHPERYANLNDIAPVAEWRGVGAFTQVNAGSFLGRYGPQARKLAWDMLQNGWIDYVASDYHARGPLRLLETREAIEKAGGAVQARMLVEENPARLLSGDDPQPVPALEDRTPGWKRFFGGR
jgi:protein-tyrosine phosphatase